MSARHVNDVVDGGLTYEAVAEDTHFAVLFRNMKAVAALGFPSHALADAACTGIAIVNDDVHFGQVFDAAGNPSLSLQDWRAMYDDDEQAVAEAEYNAVLESARHLVTPGNRLHRQPKAGAK